MRQFVVRNAWQSARIQIDESISIDCTAPFIIDVVTNSLSDAGDSITPNAAPSRGKSKIFNAQYL